MSRRPVTSCEQFLLLLELDMRCPLCDWKPAEVKGRRPATRGYSSRRWRIQAALLADHLISEHGESEGLTKHWRCACGDKFWHSQHLAQHIREAEVASGESFLSHYITASFDGT